MWFGTPVKTTRRPESSVARDIRWLLRIARVLGAWPLSELPPKELPGAKVGLGGQEELHLDRHEMSWRSYPPYLCICAILYFVWSTGFHAYNTVSLLFAHSGSTADTLVSVPWLGANVVPLSCGVMLLFRGRRVSAFLNSWGRLEKRLEKHMPCAPRPHLPLVVLVAYVAMSVVSVGSIYVRFYSTPESPEFYGNLVASPWSYVLGFLQNLFVTLTWAGYLVSEAFIMIVSHHITRYFCAVNHQFKEILDKQVVGMRGHARGRMQLLDTASTPRHSPEDRDLPYVLDTPLSLPNSATPLSLPNSATPLSLPNSATPLSVPNSATPLSSTGRKALPTDARNFTDGNEEDRNRFRLLWNLYEDVGAFLKEMNCLFSAIMLVTFAQYMLTICALAIPLLTITDWQANTGYLMNCLLYMVRFPVIVLVCARVYDASSSTRVVISEGHARLSLKGVTHPFLDAMLSVLAAQDNVGITAWGFFAIRRDTLLTFVSLVMSYIVIMLQGSS